MGSCLAEVSASRSYAWCAETLLNHSFRQPDAASDSLAHVVSRRRERHRGRPLRLFVGPSSCPFGSRTNLVGSANVR